MLSADRTLPVDVSSRAALLVSYARDAGRVSSTEASHLLDVSAQTAIDALNEAEEEGHLTPSNKSRRGRGFHYLPSAPPDA